MSMRARDLPDAVQWHEGMMLAPQHFQLASARLESAALLHAQLANSFHWGVREIAVDRAALVTGLVRVTELEAVTPDGLIVWHAADRGQSLDVDVSGFAEAAGGAPVTIHLVVPAGRSVAAGPHDFARFDSVEGPPVVDDNGGEVELRIPRLRPRLSLYATLGAGRKPPQKYVSLPIARIVRRDEAYMLDDYVPPTLTVAETSYLGRMVSDIARRARAKAQFLIERSGVRSGGGQALLQEAAAEIQGLVIGLPQLEALIGCNVAHPFQLYLGLCQFVGGLAAFAAGAAPPSFSRYDHDNCLPAFAELRDYALRLVDRVKDNFHGIPFEEDKGRFQLTLEEAWLAPGRLIVAARGPTGMSDADLVTWMQNCIIASSGEIEALWEMRVMGAGRRPADAGKDLDVTPARGAVLFAIDVDPQYVKAGQPLVLWCTDARPNRPRPTEVVLYVKAGA